MHSMTGLPWWATIPLTTFALRSSLLYLTLKAKSAGLNFVLAQQATQTATNLLEHWKQQQAGSASSTDASTSDNSSNPGQRVVGLGRQEELNRPSRWRLTRMYYRYYRKQYGTTSLWWWTANICVQVSGHSMPSRLLNSSSVCFPLHSSFSPQNPRSPAPALAQQQACCTRTTDMLAHMLAPDCVSSCACAPECAHAPLPLSLDPLYSSRPSCLPVQLNVFLAMSVALRQMAVTQWPGFTDQGLWWFTDLTQVAVVMGTPNSAGLPFIGMHTSNGTAGFLLPFACVAAYVVTKNQTPLGVCHGYGSHPSSLILCVMAECILLSIPVGLSSLYSSTHTSHVNLPAIRLACQHAPNLHVSYHLRVCMAIFAT
jgi:hypothetical protein